MQFTMQTEYSVRILLCLAKCGSKNNGFMTITELSEQLGINKHYLPKILKPLREHGLVCSETGVQGGYSLAVNPKEISMLDIFKITEGTTKLNQCLEDPKNCNLNQTDVCPVRKAYTAFQKVFEDYFSNKILFDLANS